MHTYNLDFRPKNNSLPNLFLGQNHKRKECLRIGQIAMVGAYNLPYVGKYQCITGVNTGWKKPIIITSYGRTDFSLWHEYQYGTVWHKCHMKASPVLKCWANCILLFLCVEAKPLVLVCNVKRVWKGFWSMWDSVQMRCTFGVLSSEGCYLSLKNKTLLQKKIFLNYALEMVKK